MEKYQQYEKELLTLLYDLKRNNTNLKDVNKSIKALINKDHAGMFEVINELNTSGYIHIVAKRGIGKNFFTSIPEDYLTLKGEEYLENFSIVQH